VQKIETMLEDAENREFSSQKSVYHAKRQHICVCKSTNALKDGDVDGSATPDVHVDVAALMLLANTDSNKDNSLVNTNQIQRGLYSIAYGGNRRYSVQEDAEWQSREYSGYGCGWENVQESGKSMRIPTPTLGSDLLSRSITSAAIHSSSVMTRLHSCPCQEVPRSTMPLSRSCITTALKKPGYLSLILAADSIFPVYSVPIARNDCDASQPGVPSPRTPSHDTDGNTVVSTVSSTHTIAVNSPSALIQTPPAPQWTSCSGIPATAPTSILTASIVLASDRDAVQHGQRDALNSDGDSLLTSSLETGATRSKRATSGVETEFEDEEGLERRQMLPLVREDAGLRGFDGVGDAVEVGQGQTSVSGASLVTSLVQVRRPGGRVEERSKRLQGDQAVRWSLAVSDPMEDLLDIV